MKKQISIDDFIDSISKEKIAILVSLVIDELKRHVATKVETLEELAEEFRKVPEYQVLLWDAETRAFADFEWKYSEKYGEISVRDEAEYEEAMEPFYRLLLNQYPDVQCVICSRPRTLINEGHFIDGSWDEDKIFWGWQKFQFSWVCSFACYRAAQAEVIKQIKQNKGVKNDGKTNQ